jgi:hypothetical protein
MSAEDDIDYDALHEKYENIDVAIRALVTEMTKDFTPEEDKFVRDQLSEEFRFWRR